MNRDNSMVRPGNLGEIIELDSEKKHLLEILDWVVNICKEEKINYYLSDGTLLGAVRHEGFIPWDDDIDITMLRSDYNQFIDAVKKYPSDRFYVSYSLDDVRHTRPYMRVYDNEVVVEESYGGAKHYFNLNIDIFPADGLPRNKALFAIRSFIVRIIIGMASISLSTDMSSNSFFISFFKVILSPFAKLVGFRRWYKIVDAIAKSISDRKAEYVGVAVAAYSNNSRFKKDVFLPQTLLRFENKQYSAPKNYDAVLRICYGDYMTPPPVDERTSPHHRVFYRVSK